MSDLTVDARIKFTQTVKLAGPTAIITAAVVGGPILMMQVAVFDSSDQIIDGVGFEGHGELVSSQANGTASWLFKTDPRAAYVKWGVIAVRSAGGLGRYSVTAKVRAADGEPLAIGQFSAEIAEGNFSDDIVFDGVKLEQGRPVPPVPGAQV